MPKIGILVDLCGQFDRNLTQIEAGLDVQIARRGNVLSIWGAAEARARAEDILRMLYTRLEDGGTVGPADIAAALRIPDGATYDRAALSNTEIRTRKKQVTPRTPAQTAYVSALLSHELAFGIGPAGTGKTYLAVAVGVSLYLAGEVDKIILSRPAIEAGERLGFLPGDMKDKVDPFMQPLYDALHDFLPAKQMGRLMEDKIIEIAPLAFMRGRTLANAFVVLDEAQNATAMQMKMFLTRLGEGSRMVITGDRSQVDLPRGVLSGLREAERLLKPLPNISFSYFTSRDVVRHPLVAAIIEAYDKDAPDAD